VRVRLIAIVLAVMVSGCGGDPAPSVPTPQPTLARVEIESSTFFFITGPGETLQLRAVAVFSDGSRPDVTNEAAWAVTDPAVLSVNPRGLVTALTSGRSLVTATYRLFPGTAFVTVRALPQ
jgi:hypothetical protein